MTKADPSAPCPTLTPGFSIHPNTAMNESSIRDWAGNGVVGYQAILGEILLIGKLAKRDPVEAHYWLRCAAQAGHVSAMTNLRCIFTMRMASNKIGGNDR